MGCFPSKNTADDAAETYKKNSSFSSSSDSNWSIPSQRTDRYGDTSSSSSFGSGSSYNSTKTFQSGSSTTTDQSGRQYEKAKK